MLNYDFVFLAMLLMGPEEPYRVELHRCPICPIRKKRMCVGCSGLGQAAHQMVILSWWKLRDTVEDSGLIRGLPARLLSALLRRSYRKAVQSCPGFDSAARHGLEHLRELEHQKSPSIDQTADAFAGILSSAADTVEDPAVRRPLEQLLYHVGRWIYLIDALDDLEEDADQGNYNPVALRFPDAGEREENLRTTLLHSLNLARTAYELLPKNRWSEITANVLYLGLPMVERAVFSGQWKEIKKLTVRRS